VAAGIGIAIYFGISSMGGSNPIDVIGARNLSLKIAPTGNGVAFVNTVAKGAAYFGDQNSPMLTIDVNEPVSIRILNEDLGQQHDFYAPDLNVQSKLLNYLETDTVTFTPDRVGYFNYTSSTHPEIRGTIVIREPNASTGEGVVEEEPQD
jgi:hypothetical protein